MTLWVGTYQAQGGRGLYPLTHRVPPAAGDPASAIRNASFGVWSARHRLAYFVDELEDGRIGAWKLDASGWLPAGACSTGGALPCFLSLSDDGTRLAVANYGDGTVSLIGLDADTGSPEQLVDLYRGGGRGPDPERQDRPHAHCVLFTDEDAGLFHVDLGTDRIYHHRIGSAGFEHTSVALEAPAGVGPRHLALLPDGERAVLVCELGARLLLLRREGERFECLDDVATAPEVSEGNLGGHLSLAEDGAIYVTNRGHDSLVRFAIDSDRLVQQAWWPTGGSSPRHFVIEGSTALVAHEEGGGVTCLDLEGEVTGRAAVPAAAFLIDVPT